MQKMPVQTLIAQVTIEQYHEADLSRLALHDLMPIEASVPAFCWDAITGQRGAIVADHP